MIVVSFLISGERFNNWGSCIFVAGLSVQQFEFIIAVYRDFNIVDTMMKKLDSYTSSLEEKIAERTREIEAEQMRRQRLLHSVIPP